MMNYDDTEKAEQEDGNEEQRDLEGSIASEKKQNSASELYEWVESCVFAVICILLIFTFLVRTATVSGPSMVPTMHDKDRLILQQVGYHDPQYGDVVVIDRTQSNEPPIIKRVIGKAGDIIFIDFTTGEVWRNDELLDEPYINELTVTQRDVEFPTKVPEGTVFVMGDNRNHSLDSRAGEVGMIDLRRIMGKAVFRFFPVNDIGGIQ